MNETMTRPNSTTGGQQQQQQHPQSQHGGNAGRGTAEAQQHREGPVARTIEEQTAKLPSDLFLWAAFGSIGISLLCQISGKKEEAQFVGHWAPTFLLLGLYNKIVKVAGSDRATA